MASPSTQGVAHVKPSEHFQLSWPDDYISVGTEDRLPSECPTGECGGECSEGWDTPECDSIPKRRVHFRPQLTVNVFSAGSSSAGGSGSGLGGSGTGGAATIHGGGPVAKDEVIAGLTSQLAALSRKVDDLSLKQKSSPVVVDSGSWNTSAVRPWNYPRAETKGRVNFSKRFKTAPRVCLSMQAADVSKDANFRVKVYATGIDAKGFTANADTWGDTTMYSCVVSWIAIGS